MVVAPRSESREPPPLDVEGRERRTLVRRLLWSLRPRDRRFYQLFDRHAGLCVDGLRALTALLANVADPDGRVRDVEAIEKGADRVVDEVRRLLGKSWFPPFSRTVVYELINRLDDILDLAEDAAQSMLLYHVTRLTPEAVRLAELAVAGAEKLQAAVAQLPQIQSPRTILALCAEVDMLEAQADHVMRAAMARLFREETDAVQLVKVKAIYELLESLTDRCKDVANAIESIVLKHG